MLRAHHQQVHQQDDHVLLVPTATYRRNVACTTASARNENAQFLMLKGALEARNFAVLFGGLISAVGLGVCLTLGIILFGDILDSLSDGVSAKLPIIYANALIFSILGISVLLLGIIQGACFAVLGDRLLRRVKDYHAQSVLHQRIGWFDSLSPSEPAISVNWDSMEFGTLFGELFNFLSHGIYCFGAAFVTSTEYTLVLLPIFPCMVASIFFLVKSKQKLRMLVTKQDGLAVSMISESLSGICELISLCREAQEIDRYDNYLRKAERATTIKRTFVGISIGQCLLTILLASCLGLWYGLKLVRTETDARRLDGSNVVIVFLCVVFGSAALTRALIGVASIRKAILSANEVLRQLEPNILRTLPSPEEGKVLKQLQGQIRFCDVTFCSSSEQLFSDLNFCVEAGETCALVGTLNHHGNSILLGLILRFFDPGEGKILIDDCNIKELDLYWYRQQVGYMGHDSVLFEGTIRENIAYGKVNTSFEEIKAAAEAANAHALIDAFPDGFDTKIGKEGIQLPAGQIRRIAIARALVRQPSILLLDKPSANLDFDSQRLVQKAVDGLLQENRGRTTIIATDRPHVMDKVNRVTVIDSGRVVECGSHKELIQKGGLYCKLYESSKMDFSAEGEESEELSSLIEREVSVSRSMSMSVVDPARQRNRAPRDLARRSISLLQGAFGIPGAPSDDTDDEEQGEQRNKVSLIRILALMSNDRRLFFLILGLMFNLVVGCAYPFWGIVNAYYLDVFYNFTESNDMQTTAVWLIWLAIVMLMGNWFSFLGLGTARERLLRELRGKLYAAFLQHDMGWFDREEHSVAQLTQLLTTHCSDVVVLTVDRWGIQVQATSAVSLGMALGLYFSWQIGVFMLALMPFTIYSFKTIFQSWQPASIEMQPGPHPNVNDDLMSATKDMKTVHAFSLENCIFGKYREAVCLAGKKRIRQNILLAAQRAISSCWVFLTIVFLVVMLSHIVKSGETALFDCIVSAMAMLFAALGYAQALCTAQKANPQLNPVGKVFHILDSKLENEANPLEITQRIRGGVRGKLEFRNIYFYYPTRPEVQVFGGLQRAEGLHMMVEGGETIGLVGRSGCGKSTIMKLLLRLYSPQRGQIFLDKRDITSLDIKWYRSQFSYLSSGSILFGDTIRNNILYGLPSATEEEVVAAATTVNAHGFIEEFETKYETRLSGIALSRVQYLKILLARTVIRDAPILLLDDLTKGLDPENEKEVRSALDAFRLTRNRTTLLVDQRYLSFKGLHKAALIDKGGFAKYCTLPEA